MLQQQRAVALSWDKGICMVCLFVYHKIQPVVSNFFGLRPFKVNQCLLTASCHKLLTAFQFCQRVNVLFFFLLDGCLRSEDFKLFSVLHKNNKHKRKVWKKNNLYNRIVFNCFYNSCLITFVGLPNPRTSALTNFYNKPIHNLLVQD